MIEIISTNAPYDFRKMLQRPLSRPSSLLVAEAAPASYTRAIRLGTKPVPVQVVWHGTVDDSHLKVHLPEHLTAGERRACLATVRTILSVDIDIAPFVRQFSAHEQWAALLNRYRGLRPICDGSLFESVVKSIVGQQLNIQFAATLMERLVELGGESVEWQETKLPVFPSPERVAGWSYEQLRQLAFSQRKAEYVIDFARSVVNQEVDLEALWTLPDEDVINALTTLRGIGRWTAECLLLFGMGRPDVLPAADIGVQNALKALYHLDERPKEAQLRDMAEAWRPWRSYASYYLWNSLIKGT